MPPDESDIEADILADADEQISLMEPLLLSDLSKNRDGLLDLALELTAKSAGFCRSLPPTLLSSLASLVRSMNCYYSNLIEGHDTHPVDIERAMKNDYSQDRKKRDLQIEAKAHIDVQSWIDQGSLQDRRAFTAEGVCEVHRRFCEALPEDLLWVEEPSTKERVRLVPGELRRRGVRVGRHIAVSPGALPRFLSRFQQVYTRLGKTESIIANAAAHHRLLWIHPFLDANGRVARLMSHAVFLELLDTGSIWSVARGLARNVQRYKVLLANCDLPRRNDLDGRGTLSEEALAEFTRFFLEICIDQVAFMESLMQPDRLRARILQWAETETRIGALPAKAASLLEAVLYRGELPRGDVDSVLGIGARQARRIASSLLDREVLTSESPRAPLRVAFPAALTSTWMPGLFPEPEKS
ncbi:MAG: Fic family protein [Acidobacteriota bacterium]|nr:Fic family protein [Acidobacteriota bacterium]